MLRNDISNKQAPILAFNIDNLLFNNKDNSINLFSKVIESLKSDKTKYISREINKDFVNLINNIWTKHPYSIYFITFTNYSNELYDILDKNAIAYTSLVELQEWQDIRYRCELQYTYYFDINEELLSFISKGNALHIDMLPQYIH